MITSDDMKEALATVGQRRVYVRVGYMSRVVEISDVRAGWGRVEYLVRDVAGGGEAWARGETLRSLESEGVPAVVAGDTVNAVNR